MNHWKIDFHNNSVGLPGLEQKTSLGENGLRGETKLNCSVEAHLSNRVLLI